MNGLDDAPAIKTIFQAPTPHVPFLVLRCQQSTSHLPGPSVSLMNTNFLPSTPFLPAHSQENSTHSLSHISQGPFSSQRTPTRGPVAPSPARSNSSFVPNDGVQCEYYALSNHRIHQYFVRCPTTFYPATPALDINVPT